MRLAIAALAGLVLTAAPAHALTIESRMSEDFQKKLEDDYGVREASILTEVISRRIEQQFTRQGVNADRVVVTIEDARPNRPTMQQVSKKIGLDPIRSFSLGGAKLTGVAYNASGQEIGTFDYRWYETDLTQSMHVTTWHDARWAIDRFARGFAGKLAS